MTLADKLRKDFSQFTFSPDEICRWSADLNTIFYTPEDNASLLHELGHALLGHSFFSQDIELIHMEREAWNKALEIAPRYGVSIDDEIIEAAMDTYREWLHRRSLCPNCQQTGLQSNKTRDYNCINCGTHWRNNDGRQKQLIRRKITE